MTIPRAPTAHTVPSAEFAGRPSPVRAAIEAAGLLWQAVAGRLAVRRLLAVDDRMLADIGLNRSEVASALTAPLWNDPSQRLVEVVDSKRHGRRRGRLVIRG